MGIGGERPNVGRAAAADYAQGFAAAACWLLKARGRHGSVGTGWGGTTAAASAEPRTLVWGSRSKDQSVR
jgi:hypothetical protein